jgi:putative phage-type endonuclease
MDNIEEMEEICMEEEEDTPVEMFDIDYIEFETAVHEILCDILSDDILLYSDPAFHSNLKEDVLELYQNEWDNVMDIETTEELVYQAIESFFEIYEDVYPRRSMCKANDRVRVPDILSISNQIDYLYNIPQPQQRTKEWYIDRHGLMTASNIWKVFASESQRNSLIYEKCKPLQLQSSEEKTNWHAGGAMQWGVFYEPISVLIYEHKYNTKIADFGCIKHSKYPCIGASPDGINVDSTSPIYGRMLEIKNIVNRDITGIPKEEYWIQMQIQMETCNLDTCDFLETRFKEYATEENFHADSAQEWRGVILCFVERDMPSSKPTYHYMPFYRLQTVNEWIAETKEAVASTLVLYTKTFWYLDEISCVLVHRNRLWFETALPLIQDTWDTIVKERDTGYEHRKAKKRVTPFDITNFCLVKLE